MASIAMNIFLNSLDTVVWETFVLIDTSLKDCLYFGSFKMFSLIWLDKLQPLLMKEVCWLKVLKQ